MSNLFSHLAAQDFRDRQRRKLTSLETGCSPPLPHCTPPLPNPVQSSPVWSVAWCRGPGVPSGARTSAGSPPPTHTNPPQTTAMKSRHDREERRRRRQSVT